jgi:hypothetical protein
LTFTAMVFALALVAANGGHPTHGRSLARGGLPRAVDAMAPPAGSTWIVGTVTDQAARRQDNVNVEAWPTDTSATSPAASALTYGGPNFNAVSAHGFFRLQVPSDAPYRIVFSAVDGQEDGDPFRMRAYGQNRPIMVRTSSRAGAGRVRDLGTIQLVRQGKVASKTKAVVRPARIVRGHRGKVRVSVSSPLVNDVKGRIVLRIGHHKVHKRLHVSDHGTIRIKLPKLNRLGKHRIVARFAGTSSVHSSKAKAVKVKVIPKKRT